MPENNEPFVRVRIINTLDTLNIDFNGNWNLQGDSINQNVSESDGDFMFIIEKNNISIKNNGKIIHSDTDKLVLSSKHKSSTLNIKNVPYGLGWWWEGKEDREYNGEVTIYVADNNFFEVVVKLPLEEYLKGVVPYEMGGDSPLEALKAQAVAARSEAVMALTSKLYSGPNFDLTSDVECQVFSGNKKRTVHSDKAVELTKSLILSENGNPINAYYASNCGGHSEQINNVWPERTVFESYAEGYMDDDLHTSLNLSQEEEVRKWIFSNPDVFCNPQNHDLPAWSQNNFRWQREFDLAEMSEIIAGKDAGLFQDIVVIKRGVSGRIAQAKILLERDTIYTDSELALRQLWHPPLRSSCFVLDKINNHKIIIYGAGWGHGVGMCQSGAVSMAKKGMDFKTILKHYYSKSNLISFY
jgi:SpoIID/LytB domain protein